MVKRKEQKSLLLIILFLIFGICAGLFFADGTATGDVPRFPREASPDEAKEFIYSLCSSTVAECLILFGAGFTAFPVLPFAAVFIFRGCSLGFAAKSAAPSAGTVSALVSYAVITALMVFLACFAAGFTEIKNKRSPQNFLPFAYVYLLISGASIIVKTVPTLIISEFANKI